MTVPSEQEFRAPASAWVAAIASFLFVSIGLAILASGVVMVLPKETAGIAFFGHGAVQVRKERRTGSNGRMVQSGSKKRPPTRKGRRASMQRSSDTSIRLG